MVVARRRASMRWITKPFDKDELRPGWDVGVRVVRLQIRLAERIHEPAGSAPPRQPAQRHDPDLRSVQANSRRLELLAAGGKIHRQEHRWQIHPRTLP